MKTVVDPKRFGVSFSVKQCAHFGSDPVKVLHWLIKDMGFRRFRLMSYWDEVEKNRGQFDFKELDREIAAIEAVGGVIILAVGVKQPRYPEYHWPDWAWELSKPDRDEALLKYLRLLIERYKDNNNIISYHLENEALLTGFGERIEIDRRRLFKEFTAVKEIDNKKPIVMSTSAAWGIPIIGPIPDLVGFSYYLIRWKDSKYTTTYHYAWIHRLRAILIRLIWWKKSFIHELQMEPWGPKDIWEMTLAQQDESMGPKQIKKNFKHGKATRLYPIDLWGGEWWYQRAVIDKDQSVAKLVKTNCQ